MSSSSVREALVGSVACTSPPVRFQSTSYRSSRRPARRARPPARPVHDRAASAFCWPRSSVDHQPGALREQAASPARAARRSTRAVRRHCQTITCATGRPLSPLPQHRRLALVGDPDARRSDGAIPASESAAEVASRTVCPDLLRIVLYPARLGKCWRSSRITAADHRQRAVHHEAGRAGRPLVDGEDHAASLPPPSTRRRPARLPRGDRAQLDRRRRRHRRPVSQLGEREPLGQQEERAQPGAERHLGRLEADREGGSRRGGHAKRARPARRPRPAEDTPTLPGMIGNTPTRVETRNTDPATARRVRQAKGVERPVDAAIWAIHEPAPSTTAIANSRGSCSTRRPPPIRSLAGLARRSLTEGRERRERLTRIPRDHGAAGQAPRTIRLVMAQPGR